MQQEAGRKNRGQAGELDKRIAGFKAFWEQLHESRQR
jgi:hypothetical protein